MKEYFLPTEKNNYQPRLLSRVALYLYLIIILCSNLGLNYLLPQKVLAEVSISQLYSFHNQEREKRGLSDLSINTTLIDSATRKAKAMLESNCWSHYCPNGKSPWDFFDEAGYDYVFAGENLAEGFSDTEKLMQAWMNSPTHRANVVNEKFTEMGIGYATGNYQDSENNTIVVVHFGTRNENTQGLVLPETGLSDTNKVKFKYPFDNSVINETQPLIQGSAPIESEITLMLDGNKIGKTTATGMTFAYRPNTQLKEGKHTLFGESYSLSGKQIGSSVTINFVVDTTPPKADSSLIIVKSLVIKGSDTYLNIETIDSDVYKMTEKMTGLSAIRTSSNSLYIPINKVELIKNSSLIFLVQDRAGNKAEIEIPSGTIGNQVDEKEKTIAIQTHVNDMYINVDPKDLKSKVNWGFALFLTALFGIDFAVLSKTGLTNIERSKSHLHMAAFALLLLILIIGLNSGSILTGVRN
jgi:hypothetical protein